MGTQTTWEGNYLSIFDTDMPIFQLEISLENQAIAGLFWHRLVVLLFVNGAILIENQWIGLLKSFWESGKYHF